MLKAYLAFLGGLLLLSFLFPPLFILLVFALLALPLVILLTLLIYGVKGLKKLFRR